MALRRNTPELSRRIVLSGAAALPAVFAASAAAASSRVAALSPLQRLLAEHHQTVAAFIASTDPRDEEPLWELSGALRDRVLLDPITCAGDAAAKVRMAAVSLDVGALTDGHDVTALAQVVAWLEGK